MFGGRSLSGPATSIVFPFSPYYCTGLLWFLSHACTCSFPISTSARFSAGAASPATSHRLRYAALCVACIALYYWGYLSVGGPTGQSVATQLTGVTVELSTIASCRVFFTGNFLLNSGRKLMAGVSFEFWLLWDFNLEGFLLETFLSTTAQVGTCHMRTILSSNTNRKKKREEITGRGNEKGMRL